MTTENKIERVVYGTVEAVEAEYALLDMGQDWLDRNGFTHVVKIIADCEYDVEFATSESEARTIAKDWARELRTTFTNVD